MNLYNEFCQSLKYECEALQAVLQRIDEQVVEAIEYLLECRGKIVVVGMGKCGHIGHKIAATFASTGTPAAYLHPAEALHGDLGFVAPQDVLLVLSNSGETDEITELLPHLKRLGVKMVALTGGLKSTLAQYSHAVIDTRVAREADPLNMAPTASTTAMLAVGDALAATMMKKRDFSKEDYAVFHPGGSLGLRLLCLVEELMHSGDALPLTREDALLKEAIFDMTAKRLGTTFVVDDARKLSGILTDGDLRRYFQSAPQSLDVPVSAVMANRPRHIHKDMLASEALKLMEDNLITVLPVLDEHEKPIGAVHIHDLVRAGIR